LSDGRAEALLRSALEKIVYFEARSEQLQGDATTLRAEADQLRADLAAAAHREVELRRRVAELEVELGRAHRERAEVGRVLDAMRAERGALMGKVLEAARIQGSAGDSGPDFDLAGFIAALRSEALALRRPGEGVPSPMDDPPARSTGAVIAELSPELPLEVGVVAPPSPTASTPLASSTVVHVSMPGVAVTREGERLLEQGRLGVPPTPRYGEESLFGFSVRELSSPDPAARCRAAERLRTLGDRAAAPALAAALHAEHDGAVLVAFLDAFRGLATREGAAVVVPLLGASAPTVRIAALRAVTTLDPDSAASHLARAAHDVEPLVRRRAALLAVSLGPERMLELEREVANDPDPEVRRLAVLAAGAAGGDGARSRLLSALDDSDLGVRRAAARSLARLLGFEVGHVPELSDEERRREIRRLSTLELAPLAARARALESRAALQAAALLADEDAAPPQADGVFAPAPDVPIDSEPLPAPAEPGRSESTGRVPRMIHADEALCVQITHELQGAMRGRTVLDLADQLGVTGERVVEAAALLTARGQVVRRGAKLFVA
jgi:HEAT repeat protein